MKTQSTIYMQFTIYRVVELKLWITLSISISDTGKKMKT